MKTLKRYERIDHIIESLINGNFKQAKEQTQYGCKSIPEKQAKIVGQVVGALMDKDNYNDPDLAVTYLDMFYR